MAEGGGTGAADGGPVTRVTIIVDGANVVGSRPDGWWRDRAGAAVRLHDNLAKLAKRGEQGDSRGRAVGQRAHGHQRPRTRPRSGLPKRLDQLERRPWSLVTVLLVLEGAARRAVPRIAERARTANGDAKGDGSGNGEVQVVWAPGSGDDGIVPPGPAAGRALHRGHRRPRVAAPVRISGRGPGGRAVLAVRAALRVLGSGSAETLVAQAFQRRCDGNRPFPARYPGHLFRIVFEDIPGNPHPPKKLMVALAVLAIVLIAVVAFTAELHHEGPGEGPPPPGRRGRVSGRRRGHRRGSGARPEIAPAGPAPR